ncbi:MAG: hypothetical protein NVSMB52_04630 [Chloroflexota bacterium]
MGAVTLIVVSYSSSSSVPRPFRSRLIRQVLLLVLGAAVLAVVVLALDNAVIGPSHPSLQRPFFVAAYVSIGCFLVGLRIQRWKHRRLRVRRFNELLAQTPAQFEETVAQLLRNGGYRGVQRVGGPGDLAADISCRDRKGKAVVVQCKRYAPGHRVGSRDVQGFIGMVSVHHGADYGIFVTTSKFTDAALNLAHLHNIETIDGPRLARMVENRKAE